MYSASIDNHNIVQDPTFITKQWKRLIATYIFPGSPHEINLPGYIQDASLGRYHWCDGLSTKSWRIEPCHQSCLWNSDRGRTDPLYRKLSFGRKSAYKYSVSSRPDPMPLESWPKFFSGVKHAEAKWFVKYSHPKMNPPVLTWTCRSSPALTHEKPKHFGVFEVISRFTAYSWTIIYKGLEHLRGHGWLNNLFITQWNGNLRGTLYYASRRKQFSARMRATSVLTLAIDDPDRTISIICWTLSSWEVRIASKKLSTNSW